MLIIFFKVVFHFVPFGRVWDHWIDASWARRVVLFNSGLYKETGVTRVVLISWRNCERIRVSFIEWVFLWVCCLLSLSLFFWGWSDTFSCEFEGVESIFFCFWIIFWRVSCDWIVFFCVLWLSSFWDIFFDIVSCC